MFLCHFIATADHQQNTTEHTHYASPININRDEASSYFYQGGQWIKKKETDTSHHQGAGMIVSTPIDLVRLIEAMFNNKLLKQSSVREMTNWIDDYGMGVFPYNKTSPDFRGVGHDGHIEGFSSSLQYFPAQQLAIAYCTNGEVYPKNDIMKVIVAICENTSLKVPLFDPIQLSDSILNKYPGRYMNQEMGIDVLVEKRDQTLQLSVKGNKFEIEPTDNNEFIFRPLGLFFTFDSESKTLLIRERDQRYLLTRQ